ncbi:MAG: hypothetical protein E6J06_06900 [Chloroflexi bacterium]|nr:MAG: hypothetical protein E6J06_06900 [Chloroflexota bacterium]
MSDVTIEAIAGPPEDAAERPPRIKVVIHRLDGGLEDGESDSRTITTAGFPVYSLSDPDRARFVPARDIKYVVFGSADDPALFATASGSRPTSSRARSLSETASPSRSGWLRSSA